MKYEYDRYEEGTMTPTEESLYLNNPFFRELTLLEINSVIRKFIEIDTGVNKEIEFSYTKEGSFKVDAMHNYYLHEYDHLLDGTFEGLSRLNDINNDITSYRSLYDMDRVINGLLKLSTCKVELREYPFVRDRIKETNSIKPNQIRKKMK